MNILKIIAVSMLSALFGLVHADTFTYGKSGGVWSADGNGSHATTTVYK